MAAWARPHRALNRSRDRRTSSPALLGNIVSRTWNSVLGASIRDTMFLNALGDEVTEQYEFRVENRLHLGG
jgi:hypothetical protein